jgi:VCBS repeat-containing protein
VNDVPVTVPDTIITLLEGRTATSLVGGATSLLSNDTDLDGNPLTAVLVTNVSNGKLTLNANGTFSYTHNDSETTTDSFTYRVNDGTANGNIVTVAINITPVADVLNTITITNNTNTSNTTTGNITNTILPTNSAGNISEKENTRSELTTKANDPTEQKDNVNQIILHTHANNIFTSSSDNDFNNPTENFNHNRYERMAQLDIQAKKDLAILNAANAINGLIIPDMGFNTSDIQEFAREVHRVRQEMDKALDEERQQKAIFSGITISVTTGLIVWSLRASSLLLTLFSMLPLWRGIDPLPILEEVNKRKEELEEQRRDRKNEDANKKEVGHLFDNAVIGHKRKPAK